MFHSSNSTLFLIGLGIGLAVAVVGGAAEYWLHLRRTVAPLSRVPGCLLYAIAGLILGGLVALVVSLVTTGGLVPALVMGGGVLAGFYGGFILLVALWLLVESRAPADASKTIKPPASTDAAHP